MQYVKSKTDGNWWDSAKRIAHEVKPGVVVGFENHADAAYFVEAGKGEYTSQPKASEPKAAKAKTNAKAKTGKQSGSGNAQQGSAADENEGTED